MGNKKDENLPATLAEGFNLPVISGDIQDILSEELDGLNLTFDRIKVPSGGSLAFEVPDENGESDVKKELVGIIVGHGPENVYYMNEFTGGNEPPDCIAADGKVGIGVPGGACADCPYNEWGSGKDGNGKACSNRHKVFLLQDGELFPVMLSLPVTSVKNFSDFVKRAVIKGRRTSSFITKISLVKDKSSTGIDYSKCVFTKLEDLDEMKAAQAYEYAKNIKPMTEKASSEKVPEEPSWDSAPDSSPEEERF